MVINFLIILHQKISEKFLINIWKLIDEKFFENLLTRFNMNVSKNLLTKNLQIKSFEKILLLEIFLQSRRINFQKI